LKQPTVIPIPHSHTQSWSHHTPSHYHQHDRNLRRKHCGQAEMCVDQHYDDRRDTHSPNSARTGLKEVKIGEGTYANVYRGQDTAQFLQTMHPQILTRFSTYGRRSGHDAKTGRKSELVVKNGRNSRSCSSLSNSWHPSYHSRHKEDQGRRFQRWTGYFSDTGSQIPEGAKSSECHRGQYHRSCKTRTRFRD
jgi:hypothetical protein